MESTFRAFVIAVGIIVFQQSALAQGYTEGRAKLNGKPPSSCPTGQSWTQTETEDGCTAEACTRAQQKAIAALKAKYNTGHPECSDFVGAWPPCRKVNCK